MRNSYSVGHMEGCARFPSHRVSVPRGQRITINKEMFEEWEADLLAQDQPVDFELLETGTDLPLSQTLFSNASSKVVLTQTEESGYDLVVMVQKSHTYALRVLKACRPFSQRILINV